MTAKTQKYNSKQVIIVICAYVGQLLIGSLLGWAAPSLPRLMNPDLTHLPEVIQPSQASWLGSIPFIGLLSSPSVTGWLTDKYGRKPCMFIGGSTFLLTYILQAVSVNFVMLLIARLISGFACGVTVITNITYLGEIVSNNIRGAALTGTNIAGNLGVILIYSTVPYVSNLTFCLMAMVPCGIFIGSLFYIPESPLYHAMNGKEDRATKTLTSLGRNDIDDVIQAANSEKEKRANTDKLAGWKELYQLKSNRKALFIVVVLNVVQQASGSLVVLLYSTSIFEAAGSSIEPNIATIIIGLTQLFGAIITPLFIDKIGRKILLLVSCVLCCVFLIILGLYFYLDDSGTDMSSIGWLPLVTLMAFFLSSNGIIVIPMTLIGEMFSPGARSTGTSVTVVASWLAGFGISTVFNAVQAAIGASFTFWIFAGCNAFMFLFTAIFVVETKGKSFTEIQQLLSKL